MQTVRGYLVSFALASGVLLALVVAASWYLFRYMELHGLEKLSERNNVSVTQVFTNYAADEIRSLLAADADEPDGELLASAVEGTRRKVALLTSGSTLAKVVIYDLTGRVVYSTDADMIGRRKTGNAGLDLARAGEVRSKSVWKDKINTLDGEISSRDVIETYTPVRGHQVKAYRVVSPVIGVVEVYDDVTDMLHIIEQHSLQFLLVVSAIMLPVYAGLIAIVWHNKLMMAAEHARSAALIAAAARAEAASQAKSDFLAQMGHELRTPLNAIIGFSEIIESESLGPVGQSKYKAYAGYIFSSGKHLLKIVNDILDMVKVEAGKMTVDLQAFDARDTLIQVEQLLGERARDLGVAVVLELESPLGPIVSDEGRFRQIVLNILHNAIKFSSAGGQVTMRGRNTHADIVIEVIDTGIGIAPEDMAKVMAPFGQVDSSLARTHEGTGLGLPVSKRLAELLGGALEVESTVGKGTTIRVTLPLGGPTAEAAGRAPLRSNPNDAHAPTPLRRIA
ncbi:MAG: sensor histidine kinase [Alphaproteobacteria bacterium]